MNQLVFKQHTNTSTRYSIVGTEVVFKTFFPWPIMYSEFSKWLPHNLLLLQGFQSFSLPVAAIHKGNVSGFDKGNLNEKDKNEN